jgi:hypothetical protein
VLAGATTSVSHTSPTGSYTTTAPTHRHYYALKNVLEYNGIRNANYRVLGPYNPVSGYAWNKDNQSINLISVPSIFLVLKLSQGVSRLSGITLVLLSENYKTSNKMVP